VTVTVRLLGERPELVRALAELRWAQWSDHAGREDLDFWVARTAAETGRHGLPVTFVAEHPPGAVVGGVGLGAEDAPGLPDRAPWLLGMIVHPDRRGAGVGRALLAAAERHAAGLALAEVWVATGDDAAGFYRACGYRVTGRVDPTAPTGAPAGADSGRTPGTDSGGPPGTGGTVVLVNAVGPLTGRRPAGQGTAGPPGRTAP
jgi:GNAT superfamily N-acetyltransferase